MGNKLFQSKLFSSLVNVFSSQGRKRDRRPLAYALFGTAALAALGTAAQAQTVVEQMAPEVLAVAQTTVEPAAGRYLFGQVPEPDQIGQGYVVLERSGDRVYGALYYPSSSFDCFQGQVQGSELAMTITNSYDQDSYPYSIALAEGPVVATSDASGELVPFGLDGFHALGAPSENDHRMLDMCRGVVAPDQ